MTQHKVTPVTDQEIKNAFHMLDLLRSQVRSGRIEKDYVLRQLDKTQKIISRLDEQRRGNESGERFELLYNVSRILGTSLDLQTVLDQVMDGVLELTGAERGFLMLRDDDGNLKVQAARNLDKETLSSEEFEYSRTISNHVLDTGESILTTNAQDDPRFAGRASVMTQGIRSIMATPLWARGRIIGIAYVENRVVTGLFSPQDLTTLEAMSGQAAVAIDNALLFAETDEALSRKVQELQLLRRIDMQLNEKLDPDEAMLTTLESACRIANATTGHLGLIHPEKQQIESLHHYDKTRNKDRPIYLDDVYPQAWEVTKTGKTVTFDSGQYGLHSIMIAPVIRERAVIGVVVLKREDGDSFTAEQQDLVERVVARAGVTIENAHLYAAVSAANKAKSEFVGIVAHDLKTPMTSISGYADLMLMADDAITERQEKYLKRISQTVKRMQRLVEDLADISRMESGQFLMDELRVPVANVVDAVSDTVLPEMQAREHTFKIDVSTALPDLWTDYYRLVQVLTNLLSNAYKYTPDGGTITLKSWQEGERVFFSVADTGIGLSPEAVKKLGEKFWRSEDEYTRSQPGTGLGFSITRSLVEQMGSHIQIESVEGQGSTFTFSVGIAQEGQN